MKAIVYRRYGSPDVLELKDVDKPVVSHEGVLVRVRAASVNPLDYHFMRGTPIIGRIMTGLRKPKVTRPGVDVAGVVEAVGGGVTRFHAGDEVFGSCRGAFAEYACASEGDLVLKPANITFEQAAAVPVAAYTALQGLRDKGRIRPGHKVLINGASGGVGTFAVQVAKSLGAHVTGVCSTRNVDMVRSIGADRVIDYTREDFVQDGPAYDLIFDTVGNHSLSELRRVLGPQGALVMAGGPTDSALKILLPRLRAVVVSRFVRQRLVPFLARRSKEDLTTMRGLLEAGKVTPVIDRTYPLEKVPEAVRYLEEGHARGKVIISLGHP